MRLPYIGPVAKKQGRIVLVTGAGSGIGRAIALRQAAAGDIVMATDIDLAAAEQTCALAEGACCAFELDVRDPAQWEKVTDTVISRFGVPDILVNNAGIAIGGSFMAQTPQDWEKIMGINVFGVVHGCRIVGSKMVDSGKPGHIVVIVSGAAWTPNRAAPSYSTSKAAALMIAESLRGELAPKNIGVSAICPGATRTQLGAHATLITSDPSISEQTRADFVNIQDRFAFASPDRVARAVQRAIRFNLAIVPVNFDATLAWILHRISPALMRIICKIPTMKLAEDAARTAVQRLPASVAFHNKTSTLTASE
ncbi:SDR family NAD(P)-dependent oxidoreductase [Mycobacteroides abscessus subsp. bolletii]|uniref:SDR family NAD(P)-dependent oxidoreductase n=1 Tax=Mycobacteroides abscessus TaxID=36809 RepID=UPI0019D0F5F4|nr:SDR family NAD(P)-dependent oxidoreductase [Mycobacteroides abscessus]MBN7303121.1 SDR family NAD(P)-dependent oxidoreductase [Mycobacteroides abscessus subsp. bolletii]